MGLAPTSPLSSSGFDLSLVALYSKARFARSGGIVFISVLTVEELHQLAFFFSFFSRDNNLWMYMLHTSSMCIAAVKYI